MFVKTDFELFWKMYYIFLLVFMFIYFFKDVINGQSIGKRIMKIKVVDLNGNKASLFNLIIRNITIFIWPVEALLVLLNKERLGDRLIYLISDNTIVHIEQKIIVENSKIA